MIMIKTYQYVWLEISYIYMAAFTKTQSIREISIYDELLSSGATWYNEYNIGC